MTKGAGSKRGRERVRGRGDAKVPAALDDSSPSVSAEFTFPSVESFRECLSEAGEQFAGVVEPQTSVLRNASAGALESGPPSSTTDARATSVRQERSARGQKLCNAIDAEVASRAAIIRAHTAARLSALTAQLDLQLSRLSIDEQSMPVDDFLSSFSESLKAGKQNLQFPQSVLPSIFAKVADDMTRLASSSLNTPCFGLPLRDISSAKENRNPRTGQASLPELTSWSDYQCWLQSLGYKAGPIALGPANLSTPMTCATTPKTVRLPKPGESMLSINGSPLGKFGETPGTAGGTRITRSQARGKSSKRSLRDL